MSERGLTIEQLEAAKEWVVLRGLDDPEMEGRWVMRATLHRILKNPYKEWGGFWVGIRHKTWVFPTDEIEVREDGVVAQVCRPLDPDSPELARLPPPG